MGSSLLALRKKSKFTNLLPEHERYIPLNSLPGWEQLPVGHKLPNHENPLPQTAFSRAKLGQKLYHLPKNQFDLTDPNASFAYEPLHDAALKNFFNRAPILNNLKSNGLVDAQSEVICSLKEFNVYRQYLNNVHLARVQEVRDEDDERFVEERNIKMAERFAENLEKSCIIEQKIADRKERLSRKSEERHQEIIRKLAAKLTRTQKKSSKIQKVMNYCSADYTKNRQLKEMQLRYHLQKRLDEKEQLRLQKLQQRKEKQKQISREKSIEFWNKKLDAMRKTLDRNEQLLQKANVKMTQKVSSRQKHNTRFWNGQDMNLVQRNVNCIRNGYENNNTNKFIHILRNELRRKLDNDEMQAYRSYNTERRGLSPIIPGSYEIEMENYFMDKPDRNPEHMSLELVALAVHMSLEINRTVLGNGYSVLNIIQIARVIITKNAMGEFGVLPQDDYVVSFTKTQVRSIVDDITKKFAEVTKSLMDREHKRYSRASNQSRKSATSPLFVKFPKSTHVWFTQDKSNFNPELYEATALSTEKAVKIRQIIRSELETETDESDFPIIHNLNSPDIFHMTPKQKDMLSLKMKNFYNLLAARTERLIFVCIDFANLKIMPSLCPPEPSSMPFDEIVESSARYLLSPSQVVYMKFATNIVHFSHIIQRDTLAATQVMMDREMALRLEEMNSQ